MLPYFDFSLFDVAISIEIVSAFSFRHILPSPVIRKIEIVLFSMLIKLFNLIDASPRLNHFCRSINALSVSLTFD